MLRIAVVWCFGLALALVLNLTVTVHLHLSNPFKAIISFVVGYAFCSAGLVLGSIWNDKAKGL